MATKSGQEPEKAEVIEELLDALDTTLDRVKVLYEQYFLGIQKQPPTHLHTDVERKLRDLAQLQIRNTALRYRFATLQQKFGSYNSYWRRTLRQIENGTYTRSLSKIGRQAARTGAAVPEEILAAMPKRMREQVVRDREAALALARRRERPPQDEELLTLAEDDVEIDVDDLDPAAFIHEPSDLRRNVLSAHAPRGTHGADGAHRVDEDDAEFDVDAYFASIIQDDDAPALEAALQAGPTIDASGPADAPRSPRSPRTGRHSSRPPSVARTRTGHPAPTALSGSSGAAVPSSATLGTTAPAEARTRSGRRASASGRPASEPVGAVSPAVRATTHAGGAPDPRPPAIPSRRTGVVPAIPDPDRPPGPLVRATTHAGAVSDRRPPAAPGRRSGVAAAVPDPEGAVSAPPRATSQGRAVSEPGSAAGPTGRRSGVAAAVPDPEGAASPPRVTSQGRAVSEPGSAAGPTGRRSGVAAAVPDPEGAVSAPPRVTSQGRAVSEPGSAAGPTGRRSGVAAAVPDPEGAASPPRVTSQGRAVSEPGSAAVPTGRRSGVAAAVPDPEGAVSAPPRVTSQGRAVSEPGSAAGPTGRRSGVAAAVPDPEGAASPPRVTSQGRAVSEPGSAAVPTGRRSGVAAAVPDPEGAVSAPPRATSQGRAVSEPGSAAVPASRRSGVGAAVADPGDEPLTESSSAAPESGAAPRKLPSVWKKDAASLRGTGQGPVVPPRIPAPVAPQVGEALPRVPPPPRAVDGDVARPASLAPSQAAKPLRVTPGAAAAHGPAPVETLAGPFPRIPSPPGGASGATAGASGTPSAGAPAVGAGASAARASGASGGVRSASVDRPPPEERPPPPPGMSDADVHALYTKYVQAKQILGEEADPGTYGKLLKTINAQAPKIMAQYKSRGVDFSVVVKDNQVIIRAKPKP